jgi:hypothetical protein
MRGPGSHFFAKKSRFGSVVSSLAACVMLLGACAYARRSTPLSAVTGPAKAHSEAPENLWKLVVVSADIPRETRSGTRWDDDKSPPDPYLKLIIKGEEIWETKTLDNQDHPVFNASPPRNMAISRDAKVRFELWDDDGVTSDPIGVYEGRALGEAIMDSDNILKLEGGATLTVRVQPPDAHRGTGIALYEVRKNALVILQVLPYSPAARAELAPGDRITAIDGRTIEELGPKKAESSLVLAVQKQSELLVEREGKSRVVKLDDGFVWLAM